MSNRINLKQIQPKAYKAFTGLHTYIQQTAMHPVQKVLIGLRVSQINECSLCFELHVKQAKEFGLTDLQIYAVSAWRQGDVFTETEKSILALAEEMTYIYNGVNEDTYARAAALLGEVGLAEVMVTIVTINSWNRLAISTKQLPILN
ncbi:carboxymuconolactone decarboxylase family protein [Mucilaginibacter gynuensis]|uniref:Carboxymuconolactone decarboxylase family protein n=1 Tax=Mucilaginibacter gynuensis TaxID=1302236 RepID=A0ABP8GG75_9SPHI